jgi:hypothetical protein
VSPTRTRRPVHGIAVELHLRSVRWTLRLSWASAALFMASIETIPRHVLPSSCGGRRPLQANHPPDKRFLVIYGQSEPF